MPTFARVTIAAAARVSVPVVSARTPFSVSVPISTAWPTIGSAIPNFQKQICYNLLLLDVYTFMEPRSFKN